MKPPHRPSTRPPAPVPHLGPFRPFAAAALAAALPCVGLPRVAFGQPTRAVGVPAATVPVTDPATALVDQMLALVPVAGAPVGQRPYGTREVARLAAAVTSELARRDRARGVRANQVPDGNAAAGVAYTERPAGEVRAAAIARALGDAYGAALAPPTALTLRALDFAWAHGVGSGERPRAVPPTSGQGGIDARTLPPLDLRYGRPVVQGAVGSLETGHALGVGGWLALVAQPRASLVAERQPGGDVRTRLNVEPQRLFARAVVRNVAVQAGVDEWAWGQGGAGGTFLSAAARPLRTVSVQADTAFALPGFLRGLGRWRAALAVADLGRDQNFPHAKLAAYKLNVAPTPNLEFGAGVMSQFGGRGAPRLTVAQRAWDLVPFIGWINEDSDRQSSNKVAAFDARVRVPRWAGLTAGYEVDLDDFDVRRPWGVLRDDATHTLDLHLARLRPDGSLALTLRAQRTGLRMYRHGQWTSGVTYRDGFLGTPLGPLARAGEATLTWRPRPFDALALTVTHETRDNSLYATVTSGPNDEGFGFRLVEARPVERRLRAAVTAERVVVGRGTSLNVRLGAERAGNYAFQSGTTLARPFGEAGARVRF